MCMGLVLPVVRYFSTGGSLLSYMRVEARLHGCVRAAAVDRPAAAGAAEQVLDAEPAGAAADGALNALTLDGLTSEIALRFTPTGLLFGSGTWQVDDIYVDPWKVDLAA